MSETSRQSYDRFRESLQGLKEQHENHLKDVQRSRLDREAVDESVIHRFGVCYECLCTALRCYVEENIGECAVMSDGKPKKCKEIFKVADQNRLLPSPIRPWRTYADRRNDTAHEYDCDKAKACLEAVGDFIKDAVALAQVLSDDTGGACSALPQNQAVNGRRASGGTT